MSSYTNHNLLIKQNQRCEQQKITSDRTSNESHLYCKKHFQKNPSYFRVYADFEADSEVDNSSIGKKTTNICKQNPVFNGYYTVSDLDVVLQSGYYEYHLG